MPKTFTFSKSEKLKSKKLLEQLFTEGKSCSVFPIKAIYRFLDEMEHQQPVQVGVGTSSKIFKKATQRNRIKRLLRETYRKNKLPLLAALKQQNKCLSVFLLYVDRDLPKHNTLDFKMPILVDKIVADVLD